MKIRKVSFVCVLILFAALSVSAVYGQGGNTISGIVFGVDRQPLDNIEVELLDEYSRSFARQRTNGSGRYFFAGMKAGRYTVRAMPYATDYEEQTQDVEIVNITRQSQDGSLRTSAADNVQRDFYLRLRKGVVVINGAIFVQEIPEAAKKLYEKGISQLDGKKEKEGLENLKLAIEAFPNYYLALERLGTEYVKKGSAGNQYYEAAQILLSKATEVNPRAYRSWFGLAYSLYSLNQTAAALTAAQKTLEIYPNSTEALLLSGVLLRQSKKFDEAEKQLLKAKEVSNDSVPMIHWHLALLYGNDLKRYGDAAKEWKLFLKAQPDTKDAEKIKEKIKELETKAAQG
ncbi:MAG: tetratricopeptide repeat protein [Pyrinomonadaceae bacterium]